MSKSAVLVISITIGSLVLGVGTAKITGYWRTESSKVPVVIREGEFAGRSDPSDIRGSYTFEDIQAAFGVEPVVLAEAFGLESDNPGGLQAKMLEEYWMIPDSDREVGTDSVRLFTALWTGLPHVPEETTVLPVRAVEMLRDSGRISGTNAENLMAEAVHPPAGIGAETDPDDGEPVEEDLQPQTGELGIDSDSPGAMVRGMTTFGELQDLEITEERWEAEFGSAMGSRSTSLKDWTEAEGLSMSDVKGRAQNLVDAAGR